MNRSSLCLPVKKSAVLNDYELFEGENAYQKSACLSGYGLQKGKLDERSVRRLAIVSSMLSAGRPAG